MLPEGNSESMTEYILGEINHTEENLNYDSFIRKLKDIISASVCLFRQLQNNIFIYSTKVS